MRKRLFYSLFLGAALCMTTACSDDDNNGNEGRAVEMETVTSPSRP